MHRLTGWKIYYSDSDGMEVFTFRHICGDEMYLYFETPDTEVLEMVRDHVC